MVQLANRVVACRAYRRRVHPIGAISAIDRFAAERDTMLTSLQRLVAAESPSNDIEACRRCARVLDDIGNALLGEAPAWIERDGRVHLRWTFGEPRVALLGHFDTVWPVGTLAARPFAVSSDRATGAGIFDMKAGLVQGLHAVAALEDRAGVEMLFTSDEEIASPTSRALIEDLARRVDAVLVLEPSQHGAVKVARKGISLYHLEIAGRAAHAGLEPEKGVNALAELARLVIAVEALANHALGTTVTPTVASAGIAINVVPPVAALHVDVRARTIAEQERVDTAMHALHPVSPDARLVVTGGPDRPPLEEQRARELYNRASAVAVRLGMGDLHAVEVGGGSDGNLTAAIGTSTLDGLGAVGGGAHADDEHIVVSEIPARTALLHALIQDLLRDPISR